MPADCITYHIDEEDRIVYISEKWHSFASDNMAGVLTSEYVLNKPVYDFVADSKVKHLYKMLIQRARNECVHLRLPFRCDSPDTRRYMAMEVFPLDKGLVAFKSCVLREEKREHIPLLDPDTSRSDEIVTICSWCKRVRCPDDNWLEVEVAIEKMKLFQKQQLPDLSHGMCADCYEAAKLELISTN